MVKRKASVTVETPAGKRKAAVAVETSAVKRKAAVAVETPEVKRKSNGVVKHAKETAKEKVTHRSYGTKQGVALTLGEGDVGQLGLGPDVMERVKPALVPELPEDVVQVLAGGMHTICLSAAGQVYTFGCNDEGALGRLTPEEEDSAAPGVVKIEEKIVQVSGGDSHSAALSETGQVYVWGVFRDANGPIGLTPAGKTSFEAVPIMEGLRVVKISSGTDHVVALTDHGDIYTVGNAEQGQLGRVAECFSNRGGRKGLGMLLTPDKVAFKKRKTKFSDVWTGQYCTYAQDTDGKVYAWGLNNYYQLGFGDTENRYTPSPVKALTADRRWQMIAGGQHHCLALDGDGKVFSLGRKEYGRLGLGEDTGEAEEPSLVKTLADHTCTQIACGTAVSFAVTDKGAVYGWGMGTSKQLAQKEEDDLWVPTVMAGKQLETRSVCGVTSGGQHTVLLAYDQ